MRLSWNFLALPPGLLSYPIRWSHEKWGSGGSGGPDSAYAARPQQPTARGYIICRFHTKPTATFRAVQYRDWNAHSLSPPPPRFAMSPLPAFVMSAVRRSAAR